jgi:hypothetical protein
LLRLATERADSRAPDNAGSRIEISNAIIPITTSSSTRVKARARVDREGVEAEFNRDATGTSPFT